MRQMLGGRYAVIGTSIGTSEANGIATPEPGTLEALLTSAPGPARFVPTHGGNGLPAASIAALPARTAGKNASYFPYTSKSITDYDWLAVVDLVA
jgi:erythromycin esterase